MALRYFTVYRPRQRPDMAFHRLIRSLLLRESFPLYGDGSQSRNFTYVSDVVQANLAALTTNVAEDVPPFLGQPINVGGGDRAALSEVIAGKLSYEDAPGIKPDTSFVPIVAFPGTVPEKKKAA